MMDATTKSKETEAATRQGILHLVHRAGQTLEEAFTRAAHETGLTPRQHIVLIAVAQNPDASQTKLVQETGIDRSTLADVVRRLQSKELIERKRSKFDARSYNVRLTELGEQRLQNATPIIDQLNKQIEDVLGSDRLNQLSEGLNTLVNGFEDKPSQH